MKRRLTTFRNLIACLLLVSFAAGNSTAQSRRSPVAPAREQVQRAIEEAFESLKTNTEGKNADYIPYLAKVDSKLFGIAAVSVDGEVVAIGDVNYSFAIESISKVFILALALEELGPTDVFQKIGSEPTGRPFNSVSAVEDMPTRTGNPFVNAGAIATTSLISGTNAETKWNKILGFYGRVAGEKLNLIDAVYQSEAATNDHNKALATLLKSYERMYSDPLEATDIYTKQCSVGVTAKQLAMMGATLANRGINPATNESVIKPDNIPHILATMSMAGLYDGSGGWAWSVGLPAKSGVGGGIVAVIPGKGAIVAFAPPLDKAGNSVKAQKAIAYVSEKLGINLYSPRSVGVTQ
ncbi:MAG TPA: glutaminase A [Pyrinomonadaceae bacterium]